MTAPSVAVAVLGAGGTIGPAIVRDLAESEEVGALLLLDRDPKRAAAVADEHAGGKARVHVVDAHSREALARELVDQDVLVNAANYRINLESMAACLRARTNYIDLGGLYWMSDRQLALDPDFREAGLLAVLGMGSSPGKTNVMAARAVNELGERPVSIDVVAATRDPGAPQDELTLPFSLETLLDEVRMAAVAIRDGDPVELQPLTDAGSVDLPEPIGTVGTVYALHSEMRTFQSSFGCSSASFRLSLPPLVLERVRELAAAPAGTEAPPTRRPSGEAVSIHRVEATGRTRRVTITAVSPPIEDWRLGGGVVSTGASAAAVVRMIGRGEIRQSGALPPERCVEPETFFREVEQRGCSFGFNVTEVVRA